MTTEDSGPIETLGSMMGLAINRKNAEITAREREISRLRVALEGLINACSTDMLRYSKTRPGVRTPDKEILEAARKVLEEGK